MRTSTLIPLTAFAIALSLSEPGGPPAPTPPKEARLERASRLLLEVGRTDADVKAALLALLDETLEAARSSRLPDGGREKVARARSLLADEPPGHDEAFCLLAESHRLLGESYREATGKGWHMPASVSRVEDAVTLTSGRIDDATRALREGRANDTVRLLLEATLLVLTPIPVPAGRS